jgi:uncharacterized protein (TIGR02145 family)
MTTKLFPSINFVRSLPALFFLISIVVLTACKKEMLPEEEAVMAGKKRGNPHQPDPPQPPAPYFSNCYNPLYSATFTAGLPTNVSITKNYVYSTGGSYPAFTSATINGITITTPAGTLNVGSGSIVFTASGTPSNTGFFAIPVNINGIYCQMQFKAVNAPVSGPTADPGLTAGSTGIINFIYKGQAVAYKTVRAKDGKIWLQQNLGSPQVAFHHYDESSYGDYFQWGRWDDGHQVPNSTVISGGASLLNPSYILNGNPNFIAGTTSSTKWWSVGATSSDTWSSTAATATNGKSPCAALGAGWRVPTAADWANVKNYEDLEGVMAAYMSNLKLPGAGYRSSDGGFVFVGGESYYWSSSASNSYATGLFISDNTYAATLHATDRGQGYSCRCVKD